MTREEIIQGLQFTIDMFLFDPSTGETFTEPRNDMDKTTIDACKGAVELLKQEPCEDCVSRSEVLKLFATHGGRHLYEAIRDDLPTVKPTVKPSVKECEDCVSRSAALDACDQSINIIEARDRIEELRSVQPERKTGRWIGIDDEPHEDYECSNCGYVCSTFSANIEPHTEFKFCPNCGARMEVQDADSN